MIASGQTTSTLSPPCSPMICPAIPFASAAGESHRLLAERLRQRRGRLLRPAAGADVDRGEAVRPVGGGELLGELLRLLLTGGRERRIVDRAQLLACGRHDDHDGVIGRLVQAQPHAQDRQRRQQDQPDRGEKRTAAAGDGGGAHGREASGDARDAKACIW